MANAKSSDKKTETSPPNRLAGHVSTGSSLFVVAIALLFAGADASEFQGRDPGSSLGRWLANSETSVASNTATALLAGGAQPIERSSTVFSSAAPLLAVPVAAGAARMVAGKGTAGSSVVRTVETASDRADAVVPPIKRVRPVTPSSPVVTTVPNAPPASPVVTTQVAAAPAPADRGKLAMQPYGLGAGNMARAAVTSDKPVVKAKVVCKSTQQFDKAKDACVKRPK